MNVNKNKLLLDRLEKKVTQIQITSILKLLECIQTNLYLFDTSVGSDGNIHTTIN